MGVHVGRGWSAAMKAGRSFPITGMFDGRMSHHVACPITNLQENVICMQSRHHVGVRLYTKDIMYQVE